MAQESDWGRLVGAWQLAGMVRPPILATLAPSHAFRHRPPHGEQPAGNPVVLVLWDDDASMFAANALVGSAVAPSRPWAFQIAEPNPAQPLDRLLHEREPRLLLIDVDTCEQLGATELRRLRRLCPDVDWLLTWEEPSPRWLDVLIASEARGCIDRASSTELLQRAIEAVLRGELWFPRAVSQWLYTALLQSPGARLDRRGEPSPASVLSVREAEVMDLMRRGLSNKQIADRLQISVNTAKKHVSHALEKRGLHKRRQVLEL